MSVFGVLLLCAFVVAATCADESKFNITVAAPWNCEKDGCKLRLIVTEVKEGFSFSLEAQSQEYVALAFAKSAMMGDDVVIECIKPADPKGTIEVYHSRNSGPPEADRGHSRDPNQSIATIAKNINGTYKDGRIFCSFVLRPVTQFPRSFVDLARSKYFLQIVAGDSLEENRTGIKHHTKWATTLRPVSFVKYEGKLRTVDNVGSNQSSSANKFASSALALLTMMIVLKAWL